MALNFPWEMFMQAQQQKNKNRQQAIEDLSGIGNNIASGVQEYEDSKNKSALLKQWRDAQQQAQQSASPAAPQTPADPNFLPKFDPNFATMMPQSPFGAPPPKPAPQMSMAPQAPQPPAMPPLMPPSPSPSPQTPQQQPQPGGLPPSFVEAMFKYNPQAGSKLMADQFADQQTQTKEQATKQAWQDSVQKLMNDPNTPENVKQILPMVAQDKNLAGQVLPSLMKPEKPNNEWSPVSGVLTKDGNPIEINKVTGEMRPVKIAGGARSTGFGASMGPIRQAQYTIQDLPSNQGPNTAGGAAYQVKVASRQGKSIIAKAGTPQALTLASSDLSRAIQRSAPLAETIHGADFARNWVTQANLLAQRLTAGNTDPKDVPKLRKQLFEMFDELDTAATPFIKNQLDTMQEVGLPISPSVRAMQMGETLPPINFEGESAGTGDRRIFKSLEEAESAGLQAGTKIVVNGRKATVQ